MPTSRHRTLVILSDRGRKALEEFSAATGASISGFIAVLVDESVPMLERMTHAAKIARSKPLEAEQILDQALDEATQRAYQVKFAFEKAKPRKVRRTTKKKP